MLCCCRKNGGAAVIAAGVASSIALWGAFDSKKKAHAASDAPKAAAPATPATPANKPTDKPADKPAAKPAEGGDVLSYSMKRLDGSQESLSAYKGKVILIVNTASKCGFTPQYEGLEKLYEAKKDKGFVILGFPANNFGAQEPGTDKEITEFCTTKYHVTFPMFSKISVKGEDQHPLYKQLTTMPEPIGGEIKWNFDKFLVDKSGHVVARFGPKTTPEDPAFTAKIEELMK